jgi:hypothetical protein
VPDVELESGRCGSIGAWVGIEVSGAPPGDPVTPAVAPTGIETAGVDVPVSPGVETGVAVVDAVAPGALGESDGVAPGASVGVAVDDGAGDEADGVGDGEGDGTGTAGNGGLAGPCGPISRRHMRARRKAVSGCSVARSTISQRSSSVR